MPKITTVEEYQRKMNQLNKRGRSATADGSEKQKRLEGETADYAQHLHKEETRRPHGSKKEDEER